MMTPLLIAVGGASGALARYWISLSVASPFGTLIVNVLGSALVGFALEFFKQHRLSSECHLFIVVGFAGAFTTFSAFSAESLRLFQDGRTKFAIFNVGLNLFLAFTATGIGLFIGKQLSTP